MKRRERRQYPRIEAKVRVNFKHVEDLVSEYSRNISKGGIFLKTNELLDPNAEVELTLTFPGTEEEFNVKGRVKRLMSVSDPKNANQQIYGVGIQFIEPNEELLKRIEGLIGKHAVSEE